jgi:glycerol kinase
LNNDLFSVILLPKRAGELSVHYILAIDQGTTGSRAIVFNQKGEIVTSSYREFPQYFPRPAWVEHDPEEIWESVDATIQEICKNIDPSMIAAIGITNQRETALLWDRETGRPVHNAIVWQCRRTAVRCDELRATRGVEEKVRNITGLPVDAYFSATKIEWILNEVPGLRERAAAGQVAFGTTDSWILNRLTGGSVHATDFTNASRTMLFDIEKRQWSEELCSLLKVPSEILPEVRDSSGRFGETTGTGNLPAGIPISGIAGDQQAALFGQACFSPGMIKNTYGTGAFVLMNTGEKRVHSSHGLITTLGCGDGGKPVYVLEGAIFVAGAAVQWLRDQVGLIGTASETEAQADSVDDTGGVYFVPAFVGLGAPWWDQEARGTITGITRGTTHAHLIRAALESMCYQTRDVITAMQNESDLTVSGLKIDGGAVANNFLCGFQADILGIPVTRPAVIETTAFGAACLAGLAEGVWKNCRELSEIWCEDMTFNPSMRAGCADDLYKGWLRALKQCRTR